ncbi:DNA-binding MarR family transcriptional regulator [Pedobacter sp. UYEF25]
MKSYKLIYQLLNLVQQLEEENNGKEPTIQDFTGFLLNKTPHHSDYVANTEVRFGNNDSDTLEIAYQLDNNIGRLFVFMSRYAKLYIKKALDGTPLQAAEDFTALAILMTHKSLSKTELIKHNLQEKTSGTEVIRRLIANGLVMQWDDLEDKRSKQIAISDAGKELLQHVFTDMNDVGKMITGKLALGEKLTLQYLLQKLEDFHLDVYDKKAILSKSDLKSFVEDNFPVAL